MSNRYALVDGSGLVVNLIEWNGEAAWTPPDGLEPLEAAPQVGIGWRREAGAWLEPEAA